LSRWRNACGGTGLEPA
jgi:Ca2+-binding RTX toxin-like protein